TSNDCPIGTKFFEFFNGSEEDKKLASKIGLGRRRNYYCNIVVLKNDNHPEEVGKVFKWRFGQQIQQKINDKINPIDSSDPVMVHNPFDIVPLKLKAIEKNGFRNFDTSEWILSGKSVADYVMPKASSDEKTKYMEALIEHLFHVSDFVRDDMFKSYDELVDILNDVLLNHGLSPVSKEDGGVESKTVRNNTGTSFPNFSVSSKKNDDVKKESKEEVKEETKEEEEERDPFSDEEPEDEKESTSSIVDDDLDLDKIFGSSDNDDDAPF
ncbi:MAG TPA: hypothetical protein PKG74_03400, partial [Candidatus Colwellbacteria bacterium]|nr:hypothetical protein [Candidatus Colwellbacteria bacterium]